jgi:hypothetical protein
MKKYTEYKDLETFANAYAKSQGYGSATEIVESEKVRIVDRWDYGYRKHTTGEYVSNAYRNKFGWKNTYYQSAITVVGVPKRIADHFGRTLKRYVPRETV